MRPGRRRRMDRQDQLTTAESSDWQKSRPKVCGINDSNGSWSFATHLTQNRFTRPQKQIIQPFFIFYFQNACSNLTCQQHQLYLIILMQLIQFKLAAPTLVKQRFRLEKIYQPLNTGTAKSELRCHLQTSLLCVSILFYL